MRQGFFLSTPSKAANHHENKDTENDIHGGQVILYKDGNI